MRRARYVLPALGLLCALRAEAAVDDYIGKPVASIQFLIEGRASTDPSLMAAVETRVGRPLSMADVRDSIAHLYSLARFDDIRVDAGLEGSQVALRYDLSPVHPVTRIEFTGIAGSPGLDAGRLHSAVTARYGASPPLTRTTELTAIVTDALHASGYLRPHVTPRAEIEHAPERATLVFAITPGPRAFVGAVDVEDVPVALRPGLLNQLGLTAGDPYLSDLLNTRIERYITERRKAGYYEAKLSATPRPVDDDRRVDVVLSAMLGPRVRVVFTGDPLPSDKRQELVPIEREGSTDEDLLEDSTNRIEDYLRAQGYRDAKAPHRREQEGDELRIVIEVKRGPLYRVDRIDISGNAQVPLEDISPLLRLRQGAPFAESALDEDVARIEGMYARRGFAAVKVTPGEDARSGDATGAQSLVVRIVINEGPQTLVDRVRIQGNASVPEATLAPGLGLQSGRPYYRTQLQLDRDAIELQYLNLGYSNATIDADPNFSADRTRANPVFTVHEGARVFVGHVLIVGNVRTRSSIISRELQLKPGDPMSASARAESQRRLATLGLFRRIQLSELSHGDENVRDLIVTVEEAPATTLGYGGGFEVRLLAVRTEDNPDVATERVEIAPRGSFNIGRRNFLGKNRSANLFTSLSLHPPDPSFAEAQLGTGGSWFTEYRVVGQVHEPRLFGTPADSTVNGTIEQQIRSSFNFARQSASAQVGHSLTRVIRLVGSYQIQSTRLFDQRINPVDRHTIDRLFPQVRLSSFSGSVIADTRDDALDPTSGRYLSASTQLAARAIGSEVGFVQTFLTGSAFHAVDRGRRVVLAGNARLGLATGFPREVTTTGPEGNVIVTTVDDLPAAERFFAGGDTTVRGFAQDRVGTPETFDRDGFPTGGNAVVLFNAEVRARVRGPITAVGFLDAGNVYLHASDLDLMQMRSAVGFGLRYKSPVGPIRVDLGFKVHPQVIAGSREHLTVLHFTFGQAF